MKIELECPCGSMAIFNDGMSAYPGAAVQAERWVENHRQCRDAALHPLVRVPIDSTPPLGWKGSATDCCAVDWASRLVVGVDVGEGGTDVSIVRKEKDGTFTLLYTKFHPRQTAPAQPSGIGT